MTGDIMTRNSLRALVVLATLGLAGAAAAQTSESAAPRPADDARPSDGAITGGSVTGGSATGGSIVPGETGGVPAVGRSDSTAERIKRCQELTGTLRDQCLLQEQNSSTGGVSIPGTAPGGPDVKAPPPRVDPPPQNPR
jgi:hypothetical protein